ncbi:MAG: hypothetical protein AB3K77_11325 [Methanosarcinaceae archaeon]
MFFLLVAFFLYATNADRGFVFSSITAIGFIILIVYVSTELNSLDPINNDEKAGVQIYLDAALVLATTIYVILTYTLVNQTVKNSKIGVEQTQKNIASTEAIVKQLAKSQQMSFIERQLEDFYYPLFSCLKYGCENKDDLITSLEIIFPHLYLANSEVKGLYFDFKNLLLNSNPTPEKFDEIKMQLFEAALNEANEIERELKKEN